MTDGQTTTDDGSTNGKTTRIVHAHARTDDESENGSSIDPKNGGKED